MIKNLFSLINIILVTLIVFFSVELFYQIVSAKLLSASLAGNSAIPEPILNSHNNKNPRQKTKNKRILAYKSITDRDLFKTKENAVKSDSQLNDADLEKLKQTSMKLKLFGTVTGVTDNAYAVIEETKKHKQGLYRAGDTIQKAQIKLILRKKVVLSVNGKDEILLMDENKNKKKRSSPFSERQELSRPGERSGNDETVSIDREKINESLKNINQLMSQVKVRPHFKDGKPNGLLLSHVRSNSIFKEMGLRNGDIVKGVNGNEIQSVDDALKFYESLKSSSSVEVQIERQGEPLTIGYQIE